VAFHVEKVARPHEAKCRCGTSFTAEQSRLEVRVDPERLRTLFDGTPFCSPVCVRAYVREAMEMLEGFVDDRSQRICSDLRELVLDLEKVWAALEREYPVAVPLA
jgi:hypothetical protein